jgi:hydrogenase expression/formation protein HypE
MINDTEILLAHGGGGIKTQELIQHIFKKHFSNPQLDALGDAAYIHAPKEALAMTTDGYVVKPLFFPGGNIGKLAMCGTINDLAVSGARPMYITASFFIEEGFALKTLEKIVISMADIMQVSGVQIVAGDTKVVEHGKCDGVFICTSGVGRLFVKEPLSPSRIQPGDAIIINGPIADHGMAIMAAREGLSLTSTIESDSAPLHTLVELLVSLIPDTHFMRDCTRGGLATVLCEACENMPFGIDLIEEQIPLNEGTAAACEILGLDPLYVANEGKFIAIIPGEVGEMAVEIMRTSPLGRHAALIGHVSESHPGKVAMETTIGSQRQIPMKAGDQLPRIC